MVEASNNSQAKNGISLPQNFPNQNHHVPLLSQTNTNNPLQRKPAPQGKETLKLVIEVC